MYTVKIISEHFVIIVNVDPGVHPVIIFSKDPSVYYKDPVIIVSENPWVYPVIIGSKDHLVQPVSIVH